MRTIPLTQGKVAIVDDEDFSRVSCFKWSLAKRDTRNYARRMTEIIGERQVFSYLHREILKVGDLRIDHINGDGLDNRKSNLRSATSSQNSFNKSKGGNSLYVFKGVRRTHSGRWSARIMQDYIEYWIGIFDTEVEAAKAYDKEAVRRFGEYAKCNFPIMATVS